VTLAAFASAVLCAAASCAPGGHVKLEPAPPGLPFDERIVLYNRLAGTRTIGISCVKYDCTTTNELVLDNGRRLRHPEDVLQVVSADSDAAHHARAARTARRRQTYFGVGGLALAVLGGTLWYLSRPDDVNGRQGSDEGQMLGIGFIAVGALGGGFGAWHQHSRAEQETKRTFELYPEALEKQLGICWVGALALPCEDPDPWKPREVSYYLSFGFAP
jgi:hypothetical protein